MGKKGGEVLITPHRLLFCTKHPPFCLKNEREKKLWKIQTSKLGRTKKSLFWRGPNYTTPATFLCTKQPTLSIENLVLKRWMENSKVKWGRREGDSLTPHQLLLVLHQTPSFQFKIREHLFDNFFENKVGKVYRWAGRRYVIITPHLLPFLHQTTNLEDWKFRFQFPLRNLL